MTKFLSYKKLASLLMLVTVTLTGCFEESGLDVIYDGPTVVEWDRGDTGSEGVYLAGSGQVPEDEVIINLVGPQQSDAVAVQWRIDQEASTAIEGVHYNLISDPSVAIPANSSSTGVKFEVITDNFTIEDNLTLVFEIVDAGVPVSANYSTLVHSLSITCPSEIPAGEWVTNVPSPDGDFYVIEIKELGGGKYTIPNMNLDYQPGFYGTFNTLPIGGGFTDVCNVVTFGVEAEYGVTWTGTGIYDAETQTITVPSISDPAYGQGPWDNNGNGFVFTKL